MTIPTPTFENDDFSDISIWPTQIGSPAFFTNPFGGIGIIGDGVNDRVSSTVARPFSGLITDGSCSIWFNSTAKPTATEIMMAQNTDAASQMARLMGLPDPSSNLRIRGFVSDDPATDNTRSTSDLVFNDGEDHHFMMTFDTNEVNILVDGVEVAYQAGEDSRNFGSGFTDMGAFAALCHIGDFSHVAAAFDGQLFRFKAWDAIKLTAAEVLEEYDSEFIAKGNSLVALLTILDSVSNYIGSEG